MDCKCLQVGGGIYKDNWQAETNLLINQSLLEMLANYCDEFLIHATDFEGKCDYEPQ